MNLTPYYNDGIELHINNETGECFASIRGAARICGVSASTISRYVGVALPPLKTAEVYTPGGLQGVALLDEKQLITLVAKYNPTLLAKFVGYGGLRNYAAVSVHTTATEQVMNDSNSSSIIRGWNGRVVRQREDGYMSLTDMAQACGKRLNNWSQLESTKSYLVALSTCTGIPADVLINTIVYGDNSNRGTWGHRKVALRFAQWCSDEFAIQVDTWVEELLTTGKVELAAVEPAAPTPPLPTVSPKEIADNLEYINSKVASISPRYAQNYRNDDSKSYLSTLSAVTGITATGIMGILTIVILV
ncbi:KilA-N domain-containing protein [Anabaena sp. CCY 9402-a]|uniref:KilA-N domain-containing protein n=1 Tax=Anabaena sp. CCY 9402-a TaxID=3103867 RepID=UPI0039C6173D